MKYFPLLIAAALATSLIAAPAWATIAAFWQQNSITAQAIAADPTGVLANSQSWSLFAAVTIDGDWADANLRVVLPSGATFYNTSPSRGGGDTTPSPSNAAMFPDVVFDTYVAGGMPGGQAIIDGGFPSGAPISFGAATDPLPGIISVHWGDLVVTGTVSFQIARLTFPSSLSLGNVYVQNDLPGGLNNLNNSRTAQISPDLATLIPSIPEPAHLTAICLPGIFALRRQRR